MTGIQRLEHILKTRQRGVDPDKRVVTVRDLQEMLDAANSLDHELRQLRDTDILYPDEG